MKTPKGVGSVFKDLLVRRCCLTLWGGLTLKGVVRCLTLWGILTPKG